MSDAMGGTHCRETAHRGCLVFLAYR